MKHSGVRFFFILIAFAFLSGCGNQPIFPLSAGDQSTPYPAKEIYVTEGSFDNPYRILGPVEYTLESGFSLFSTQTDLQNQATEALKREAVSRYGTNVDAIIDLEFQENPAQDFFSSSFINARGVAIVFDSVDKSYSKLKKKHKKKPVKKKLAKPKSLTKIKPFSKNTHKAAPVKPEEPEITPSELLK